MKFTTICNYVLLLLVLSFDSIMCVQHPGDSLMFPMRQLRKLSWADKTSANYIPEDSSDSDDDDDDDDDDSASTTTTASSSLASLSSYNSSSFGTISAEASYAYMHPPSSNTSSSSSSSFGSTTTTKQNPWNYTVDVNATTATTTAPSLLLPKEPKQARSWPLYISFGFGILAVIFGVGACIQMYQRSKRRRQYQDIPADLVV